MEEEKGISLSDILRVIKKNIILICIVVFSMIILGGVYTFGMAKETYRSETTVIVAVREPDIHSQQDQSDVNLNDSAKLLYTVKELIKEDIVLGEVAREHQMSPGALKGAVSISNVEYSFLIQISVVNKDKALAKDLAHDLAEKLIEVVDTNPTLDFAKGTIAVTSPARDAVYNSPNKMMYMMIFTLLGIVLACVIVFIMEFASNKYRTKKDIEAELDERVLGQFFYKKDKIGKDKNGKKLINLVNPTIKGFESYNKLLSNIKYSNLDNPYQIIGSMSTNPDELKTTVSANLAYCMAHNNKKVCVIDLDLRKPMMHKAFNVSKENGLIDYLEGTLTKEELIQHSELGVDVITSGKKVVNPIAVLESVKLEALIAELRKEYDYIVIDSAPLSMCADSLTVAKMCDMVMFNIALRTSKKNDVKEAIQSLKDVDVKNIGINVTKVPADKDNDYYYYGE